MTCEACCREFKRKRWSVDCPHCGFNNGRGWWPRSDDPAGVAAGKDEKKRFMATLQRRRKTGPATSGGLFTQEPEYASSKGAA